MNPRYFGDSYDIVKRFFCAELAALGYTVLAWPMFTGDWSSDEEIAFLRFIGASALHGSLRASSRTALFFDPDTGVHRRPSPKHISLEQFAAASAQHELAFAFDQSFSRQQDCSTAIRSKLAALWGLGCHALYYDSHARFLFASQAAQPIAELREHLMALGLPASRFVAHDA